MGQRKVGLVQIRILLLYTFRTNHPPARVQIASSSSRSDKNHPPPRVQENPPPPRAQTRILFLFVFRRILLLLARPVKHISIVAIASPPTHTERKHLDPNDASVIISVYTEHVCRGYLILCLLEFWEQSLSLFLFWWIFFLPPFPLPWLLNHLRSGPRPTAEAETVDPGAGNPPGPPDKTARQTPSAYRGAIYIISIHIIAYIYIYIS